MGGSHKHCILHAHLAALLFGGTALFAKWIILPADVITFWRTFVAIVVILLICLIRGQSLRLERKRDAWIQIGLGGILGIHWATYFASIQLSTIAIGVTSLFASPVLSVLIESALRKVWPDRIDLALGGVVFIGVLLLSPDFSWQNEYARGVLLGVTSAFFLATRQVLHARSRARSVSGLVSLFYQLIGIGVLFAFSGFTAEPSTISSNWLLLLVLGAAFTAAPHFYILSALRGLKAKTVLIITSLMVPYGILFSSLLIDEIPSGRTLIGCALIMFAAIVENIRA